MMREEWGFRFFICAAGAIPVVVVFILLFKSKAASVGGLSTDPS